MSLGSVSNAARALHMSQPNASKMLKKIEDQFGFLLFERINSRLHPTEEARLIFDQAERTLISLRRFISLTVGDYFSMYINARWPAFAIAFLATRCARKIHAEASAD